MKFTIHGHLPLTGVTLSGDGRNDLPGHTARYCVYTLMEETSKVVVDLEVVDKWETGGKSAVMEKLALSRLLCKLKDVLNIAHLVTDASTSIKALVREMKGKLILFIILLQPYVEVQETRTFMKYNIPWLLFGDLLYFEIHVMSRKLQCFFFFIYRTT